MTATEQITNRLQMLPPRLQREVLDFIEFLLQKVSATRRWQRRSGVGEVFFGSGDEWAGERRLAEYSEADLKEIWQ